MRIDCPGGAAGTSQAIYNELTYLKEQYPTNQLLSLLKICAHPARIISQAQVTALSLPGHHLSAALASDIALPRLKEFINQYKIEYSVTKTGKYKAILNPLLDATKDEQDLLQELCNNTYQQFITDVSKSRPALALKDAEIGLMEKYLPVTALVLKLIRLISVLSLVEQEIRERAHIPSSQEIQWVKAEQKNIIMKILYPDDSGESNDDMSLSGIFGTKMFNSWITSTVYCTYVK